MPVLSFENVSEFIRKWGEIPADESIRPDTQFERDLGITGDDGGYLLQAIEKHFSLQLATDKEGYRVVFGLGSNEYLFKSEGYPLWELLPFVPKSTVKAFTVGELHAGLLRAAQRGA